jgi:putative copper resistance protein D
MVEFDVWVYAAIAAKVLIYAGSLTAIGLLSFQFAIDRSITKQTFPYTRWLIAALLITALATLMRVGVRAGLLIDDGLQGMVDPEMLQLTIEGPLGFSSMARLLGVLLIFGGLLFPLQRVILMIAGSLCIAISFALVGHATGVPRGVLTVLIILHVIAGSFWFGALGPIYHTAAGPERLPDAAILSHRFGVWALWIVVLLIVVGASFIILRFGNPLGLVGSAYGWVLLGKLVLVSSLLALAALNKLRLVPAMAAQDEHAAHRLRHSIRWEVVVFLAIFVATAVLTTATQLPGTQAQ